MKKLLCIVIGLSLLLSACKKDNGTDDIKLENNSIILNDISYELSHGLLEIWVQQYNDVTDKYDLLFNISLFSPDVTIEETGGWKQEPVSGFGHIIKFRMVKYNVSYQFFDIVGNYQFRPLMEDLSFNDTFYAINYNFLIDLEDSEDIVNTKAGSVSIVKINNDYEIAFILTDENNNKIEGYYKGPLALADYSEM